MRFAVPFPGRAVPWGFGAVVGLGLTAGLGAGLTLGACVPSGSAPPYDAGASPTATISYKPSLNALTTVFEDTFDRPDAESTWPPFANDAGSSNGADSGVALSRDGGSADAGLPSSLLPDEASEPPGNLSSLGPNWLQVRTNAWKIENGQLCVQNAHNKGIWLNKTLPVNARIEFDAIAGTDDGDLKTEVWGDGRSAATGTSYTNATSYLAIFGGWKNTSHVLARKNEHGTDRKEIKVDKDSDDPRQRPVVKGQVYHFKIERSDGKTVHWSIDGLEYASWVDPQPLAGQGHDHFGFNEWEAKVCFDNIKVTPL